MLEAKIRNIIEKPSGIKFTVLLYDTSTKKDAEGNDIYDRALIATKQATLPAKKTFADMKIMARGLLLKHNQRTKLGFDSKSFYV